MSLGGPVKAAAPFSGITVVDLSDGVAGQYCAKLFATYGAECVLIEAPGGSPTRGLGPRREDRDSSPLFTHLNQGKRAAPASELSALLARADVVVRDQLRETGFVRGEHQIECVISEFPGGSEYEGWIGSEMIHQAMSGAMYPTGRPDREPIYGLGHRGYYACGTTAFISAAAALIERCGSGLGQIVRASTFECLAAIGQNLVSQYSYTGAVDSRRRYPGYLALLPCKDSWIVIFAIRNWEALPEVFDLPELLDDPRLTDPRTRLAHWDLVTERLTQRARELSAADVVEALQKRRVSAEVVATVDSLITSEQWKARRMIWPPSPSRAQAALRGPFQVGPEYPPAPLDSPPLPASGTAGAPRAWSGADPRSIPSAEPRGRARHRFPAAASASQPPLSGVRVLDLTTAWAGPFAARSLAFLGAEVIKIDAPTHMDSWRGEVRGGAPERYPNRVHGDHPWNRCVLFNTQGQGKRSVGLDIKAEGGARTFRELAAVSDIVIANFTPGVLDRLGIGYQVLAEQKPSIVVVEMPAFGAGGPASAHQGMGKTMEAACGMASMMGYGDGVPVLTGPAYLDPIGGLNAVAATLTAWHQRLATGRGCRVEIPQTEAGVHWIGELVLARLEGIPLPEPATNSVPGMSPHGAFPCRGDDQWVVMEIRRTEQWSRLCAIIEDPELADPSLNSLTERVARAGWVAERLGRWTSGWDKHYLARRLQAAGVPAAPVNDGRDVANDPVLRERGFLQYLDHPEAGTHLYPTLSYLLERTPGRVKAAAPCFGADNDLIFGNLLGYSPDQLRDLRRCGVINDHPK